MNLTTKHSNSPSTKWITSIIFFSKSTSGFSKSKVTGFGLSFKGFKGERWVRTPPFTFGSGLSGQGYSCFFTFLILAITEKSLVFELNLAFPRVLKGMPLTPLLELRRRSEAEVPVSAAGEWDTEDILLTWQLLAPNLTTKSANWIFKFPNKAAGAIESAKRKHSNLLETR